MSNIPGVVSPGAYSSAETLSSGASVPNGIRIASIIGEGTRTEVLVASAVGSGKDGLNSSYTSSSGADGRHFRLNVYPLISNRTTLYKNGVPLTGLESVINTSSFSNKYDYRIDITTGKIELQKAYLVDQGGSYYKMATTNVGIGTVSSLQLVDVNAPKETWTIKCISVQRNGLNQPIGGTAKFIAYGSVSGTILNSNGTPFVWKADGQIVNNGIIKFAISETQSAPSVYVSPFREGDSFTIKVNSGSLLKNETLVATYIATTDLNDPTFLSNLSDIKQKHGVPSTSNTLALGCQLAFANQTPGVLCVQAAPPLPRRTSYSMGVVNSTSLDVNEYIFPFPVGVVPNIDSTINFFVTDNTTGTESQILPNKFDFYQLGEVGQPTINTFVFDSPTGSYGYSYSLIQSNATVSNGVDGYMAPTSNTTATFSSSSLTFDSSALGLTLHVEGASNVGNNGNFTVTGVSNGELTISASSFADFTNESSVSFEIVDAYTLLAVPSASDTDGVITAIISSGTATFHSDSVTGLDFSSYSTALLNQTQKLKISGTDYNDGVYLVTNYNSGTNALTIQKTLVLETSITFELQDPSQTGDYLVINQNVVPNGYSLRVTIIDDRDATFYDSGWLNALEALESFECDIVVPLPTKTISAIFQNTLAHCRTMSNIKNRKERVLFTGAINGLLPTNITGEEPAAVEDIGVLEGIQGDNINEILAGSTEDLTNYSVKDAFGGTYRCLYLYPDQIVVNIAGTNTYVDGFYMAAAAAGYCSSDPRVSNPLTNKILTGFNILRDRQFSPTVEDSLLSAGVALVRPVTGGGKIVWGRTTSASGYPEEEELSIVFIRDRISKSMRAGYEGFVGEPESDQTQSALSARGIGLLTSFISQGLITQFKDLVVSRDKVDPRQWNVTVRVQPVYPINWIYIKISVGTL